MDAGERRESHIASGFGLVDGQFEGGGTGVVVASLTLRSSETGDLISLCLQKTAPPGRLGGTTEENDGISETMLDAGEFAQHRVPSSVEPRVVDHAQPMLDLVDGIGASQVISS